MEFVARGQRAQQAVDQVIAQHTKERTEEMNPQQEKKLDKLVDTMERVAQVLVVQGGKLQVLVQGGTLPPAPASDREGPATRAAVSDLASLGDRDLETLAHQLLDKMAALAEAGDSRVAASPSPGARCAA